LKKIKKILLIILLSALIFQMVQFIYPVIKVKPLNGFNQKPKIEKLWFSSWSTEQFQDKLAKYIDYYFGFRPVLIRLYNQIQFSLFKKATGNAIIVGKEDYLYQEQYILDFLGSNYIGKNKIKENVAKLEAIRNFLTKWNTELLIVLSPGKGFFYPEYIPDYYERISLATNYTEYRDLLTNSSLPLFDVNGWFLELKMQSNTPPLFTQTGIHWSEFGAKLVADSLIRLCENTLNRSMNQIHITDVEWSDSLRSTDNDLEKLMNVNCPINTMTAAHPCYTIEKKVPLNEQPALIVDSDSFFWNLYDGVLHSSFKSIGFWYYYSTVYPEYYQHNTHIEDVSVPIELLNADLIILMCSTAELDQLGFGFIDDVYSFVTLDRNQQLEKLAIDYQRIIPKNTPWMENIIIKADQRNISVDSMLKLDAKYMAGQALSK